MGRTAIFPGENYLDQIQRVISVLGTQGYEDICFISNQQALDYLKSLPKRTKINLQSMYPQANPVGLDLLSKMLAFNPNKRYTAEECLNHPYFEGKPIRLASE